MIQEKRIRSYNGVLTPLRRKKWHNNRPQTRDPSTPAETNDRVVDPTTSGAWREQIFPIVLSSVRVNHRTYRKSSIVASARRIQH